MGYDRDNDELRALRQVDPPASNMADAFPELPLGSDAFRSPLHTLPSDVPARKRIVHPRTVYFVVASMSVALGVLAVFAMREPSPSLTEAREDLVAAPAAPSALAVRAAPAAPAKAKVAAPALQAGVINPVAAVTANPQPARAKQPAVAPPAQTSERARPAPTPRAKATPRKVSRAKPKPKLPEQPSRSAVLAAMRSVTTDARRCLSGGAIAQAHITFKGETGRVLNATVKGVEPAAASCVARAVRAARLPPFSKPQLEITFPFRAGS